MENRLELIYNAMPFSFCVVVAKNEWGKHSAIVADYNQLKDLFYDAIEAYVNRDLRIKKMGKLNYIVRKIGELELTEYEQEWLMKNRSKFKAIKTDFGTIYETPNVSFKENYEALHGKIVAI